MSRRSPRIFLVAAVLVLAGGLANTPTARAGAVSPPSIVISFDTQAIQMVNGWSTLTITVTNPNRGTGLTGVSFTATLSAGIIFANPDSLTPWCGEWPTLGISQISLSDQTMLAGSSCTTTVDVLGVAGGPQTSTAGPVTSNEGGAGNTATAPLYVAMVQTTTAVFGDASIPFGGSTTLTFTVTNPNPSAVFDVRPAAISEFFGTLSGIGFVDTLPAGLIVATPNGLTGSCGGGTITATAGSGSITLADAALAAGASCTFALNVTGVASGIQENSTGPVNSVEGGTGDPGTGSLAVGVPQASQRPAVTAPPSSTVRGGGSDGGAPATPFLLLMAAMGLAMTVAIGRSARARG